MNIGQLLLEEFVMATVQIIKIGNGNITAWKR